VKQASVIKILHEVDLITQHDNVVIKKKLGKQWMYISILKKSAFFINIRKLLFILDWQADVIIKISYPDIILKIIPLSPAAYFPFVFSGTDIGRDVSRKQRENAA
jgi:hypothetical protein